MGLKHDELKAQDHVRLGARDGIAPHAVAPAIRRNITHICSKLPSQMMNNLE